MAIDYETFPIQLQGGLINNISPLQQGLNLPGSARLLQNFEPSIEGGYKRIKGYTKFDDEVVPAHNGVVVQGSGQSGTSLAVANIMEPPEVGETFTINSVTGTYTISAVSYNNTSSTATLTITPTLASSPADKAAITFTSNPATVISFVKRFNDCVIAKRGGHTYESDSSGWTRIDTISYGTTLVNGGSQTGTTLIMDGFTSSPSEGDTFSVNGIEKVYTITTVSSYSAPNCTCVISPALDSSPADNAAIIFLSTKQYSTNKTRGAVIKFTATDTLVTVDGVNNPQSYDGTTWVPIYTSLSGFDDAVIGAEFIQVHKSNVFYAKGNNLCFTAPYTYNDFAAANGAGTINLPDRITGMITFREQLIIFCNKSIHRITGTSLADYVLQPIIEDMGCIASDTIQEVAGDILFLSQDGVRFLSATERIGDFGFASVSRNIQKDLLDFVSGYDSFNSLVVREKSQYRLFGYSSSINSASTEGFLATQFGDQNPNQLNWAKLKGIRVYVCDSSYDDSELIYFANVDGYVYTMESGKDFDGEDIVSAFFTPYLSLNDPRFRKTIQKITIYVVPDNSVDASVRVRYDFGDIGRPQPSYKNISIGSTGAIYGTDDYGSGIYGGYLESTVITNVEGSGYSVSLEYRFEGGGTFTLDTIIIEFQTNDRR